MPVIKNGQEIENIWSLLEEDEEFTGQLNKLLTKEDFLSNRDKVKTSNAPVGIALNNDDDVMELEGLLDQVDIVTVNFPSFADGRAFSQARLVRERLGFEGEIRAVGHIIRDQYLYLLRSGVDAIDADRASESEWKAAVEEFDTFYQAAHDKNIPAYLLRHLKQEQAAD